VYCDDSSVVIYAKAPTRSMINKRCNDYFQLGERSPSCGHSYTVYVDQGYNEGNLVDLLTKTTLVMNVEHDVVEQLHMFQSCCSNWNL
jgi:uncharacterized protein YbbK (DUF523 family)